MIFNSTNSQKLYEDFIGFLVDRRKFLVIAVILLSALAASQIPKMKADVTLKSGVNTESPEYLRYKDFLKYFGNEEFILLAIRIENQELLPDTLKAITTITQELQHTDKIVEVISLANLKVFRERNGLFGNYSLIEEIEGKPALADAKTLAEIRSVLSLIDLLVSPDEKTFSVMVRMDDRWSFDPPVIEELVQRIRELAVANLPASAEFRIIGAPVIRKAIHDYNKQTAVTFGILCMLVCTLISIYIFKSLKAMAVTVTVVGICDLYYYG